MSNKPVVLIVDDAPENIQAMAQCLKEDYQLKVATDGKRCLELVKQDPIPDLILLDVIMPEMNGYDVIQALKSEANLADIPVIFVTGKTEASDEEKGLALGAVDYISKPFRPSIVKARVKTHVLLKRQRDQLANMAMCDQLTGLYNRYFLIEAAMHKVAYARRHQEALSVLIIDIDHFKEINDNHGHSRGDEVLRLVAESIQSACRKEDILGRTVSHQLSSEDKCVLSEAVDDGVVARYGGEEFVVLLSPCDEAEARDKAEKLRREAEELMPSGIAVTVSIGVAELGADENFESLIKRADDALYQAKDQGRNQVCMAKSEGRDSDL